MKIYTLRARTMRSGGSEWLAEVDADELRRALAADPLDAPTTIHVNVSGNIAGTEEFVGEVIKAIRRDHTRRVYQRRQAVCTFAGPDKRRYRWRIHGRRSTDLYRSDRRHGLQRRLRAERRTTKTIGFWRHRCTRSVIESLFIGLWSAYCPDCGASYTTVHDRRLRLSSRREFLTDRRRP